MTTQVLPLTNAPERRVTATFEGDTPATTCITYWNSTKSTWQMDLLDSDQRRLIAGMTLLTNVDMIGAHPSLRERFQGQRMSTVDFEPDAHRRALALGEDTHIAVHEHIAPEAQLPALLVWRDALLP